MTIPAASQIADRDRQFDDWGESITFRQFTTALDPQTQELTETQQDTVLTAITGNRHAGAAPPAASRQLTVEIEFLVKADQLPAEVPSTTSRVIYGGDEYDVLAFTRSQDGLVEALACRKVA